MWYHSKADEKGYKKDQIKFDRNQSQSKLKAETQNIQN